MVNYLLIILTCFYLPVFIIRATVVRFFGPSYGIKVLDDLLNPCISASHHDSTHGRSPSRTKKQHEISNTKLPLTTETTDNKKKKKKNSALSQVSRRTIDEELALTEQAFAKMDSMQKENKNNNENKASKLDDQSQIVTLNNIKNSTKELLSEELL